MVRVLAKKDRNTPMRCDEIAAASGLDIETVRFIASRPTWDAITLDHMRRFTLACGIDFTDHEAMKRIDDYLRTRPKWTYLKRSPQWRELYEPIITIYLRT